MYDLEDYIIALEEENCTLSYRAEILKNEAEILKNEAEILKDRIKSLEKENEDLKISLKNKVPIMEKVPLNNLSFKKSTNQQKIKNCDDYGNAKNFKTLKPEEISSLGTNASTVIIEMNTAIEKYNNYPYNDDTNNYGIDLLAHIDECFLSYENLTIVNTNYLKSKNIIPLATVNLTSKSSIEIGTSGHCVSIYHLYKNYIAVLNHSDVLIGNLRGDKPRKKIDRVKVYNSLYRIKYVTKSDFCNDVVFYVKNSREEEFCISVGCTLFKDADINSFLKKL